LGHGQWFSKVAVEWPPTFLKSLERGIIYGDLPATLEKKSVNQLASVFRKVGGLSPATLENTPAVSLRL
jgi:hypothetical protein